MDHFEYRAGELYAENVSVTQLAQAYGTPLYVYSKATLERHWQAFDHAFDDYPHLVCYAVKANSNLAVLQVLARLGSGFDVVSLGEIQRVLRAGAVPEKIVFSGVGKTAFELKAALQLKIGCFNVESAAELEQLAVVAQQLGTTAPVSIRVNPDVDAKTHPYISTGLKENKFGVDPETALKLYTFAQHHHALNPIGIDCHIGSQLTELAPFMESLEILLTMVTTLTQRGIELAHIDIGGGLGVTYDKEQPPHPREFAAAIKQRLLSYAGSKLAVYMEPGRAIAANAGIFITQVEYLKSSQDRNFAIVDGAMNDLLRPALYQAWQAIIPVIKSDAYQSTKQWDVVGPVCESADFLGKNRALALAQGDLLAIRSAGAYGFCMSSTYNTRNRAAEVLVDGDKHYEVRRRETIEDQLALERVLP